MIMTSYFASKAPADRKVCIAKKRPRYFRGKQFIQLAPTDPWADDWRTLYQADLKARFPGGRGLRELLEQIQEQIPDPILCCYEKDPGTCHRREFADYAQATLGLQIPEWS
jgi:hypothetical protein